MTHGLHLTYNGSRYSENLLDGVDPTVQAVLEDWYFGAPTQGNVLDAGTGSFIFTGKNLTAFKVDRILSTSPVSFSLTLKDLTGLFLGQTMITQVGNFVLTGNNLTALKVDRLLSGTVQTYALTSKDLTALITDRSMAVDCGEFHLTGLDTRLTYAPKVYYSMETYPGEFTLILLPVGLDYSGSVTAPVIVPKKQVFNYRPHLHPRVYPRMDSCRMREEREEWVIL